MEKKDEHCNYPQRFVSDFETCFFSADSLMEPQERAAKIAARKARQKKLLAKKRGRWRQGFGTFPVAGV